MNPDEQKDYKKALLFKISIIVIVAAISFLWLANLQNVFKSPSLNSSNALEQIKRDMDKSMKDAEASFDKMAGATDNKFVKDLVNKASSTATSTLSTTTASIEVKKELTNLIKTTSTVATSTNPKKVNCPEYINCMPTIGEAKPCVVPAGCEKITQIAY